MSQFQKIAVGLLGFTHPEMFIPISRPAQKSTAKIEVSCDHSSNESVLPRDGQGARAVRAIRSMVAALTRFANGSSGG
jgi:predicted RNA-binding protein YlqC (UPF0109 family)